MSMALSDSESALHCKRRARSISALRRAADPLSRPFLASGAGAGGTGAGGGSACCLGGGTGRVDRSGAGVDPAGPSAGCGDDGTPSVRCGAEVRAEVGASDKTVAAEGTGAVSATALASTLCSTPALSGNRCRPPTSEERGSVGSHLEHQLLGTRGPPTALTLHTASSSTGSSLTGSSLNESPAELGGPGGSDAGLAPLRVEQVGRESDEQESSGGSVCLF